MGRSGRGMLISGNGTAGGGSGAGTAASTGAEPRTLGTYFMAPSLEPSPRQPIVFLQSATPNAARTHGLEPRRDLPPTWQGRNAQQPAVFERSRLSPRAGRKVL
jgi:hypothetical protein